MICSDELRELINQKGKGWENMQPLLLCNIEKLLWDAIFSVAWGKEMGDGALTTFLTLVPWD